MIPGICKTRLRYHSSGHQVSVSLNPCTVVWLTPSACLLFDQQSQEEIRATPELCLLIVVAVFTSFLIEVVLILLCCSQHSLTLDHPSCFPVTKQTSRYYSIGLRLLRTNYLATALQHIRHESFSSSGMAAVVVLVCERPPMCMPVSRTNLLLSLFTANKGDNYVMSTFRRLEVGVAICLWVSAEIKAVRSCPSVAAVKPCVVLWWWLQVNGIPEERKVAEALNLWPETPLSTFYSISIFFSNICANLHASEVSLQRFIVHMHLHLKDSVKEQQSLAHYKKHLRIFWNVCVDVQVMFVFLLVQEGKGVLHGNASVVMLLCVLCHMIIIKTLCQYFHRLSDVWMTWKMSVCPQKRSQTSTFYERIINNVQQNKSIYK